MADALQVVGFTSTWPSWRISLACWQPYSLCIASSMPRYAHGWLTVSYFTSHLPLFVFLFLSVLQKRVWLKLHKDNILLLFCLQPALLYLVPACLGFPLLTALFRGELSAMLRLVRTSVFGLMLPIYLVVTKLLCVRDYTWAFFH